MSKNISERPITNLFHDCGSFYVSTIEPDIGEAVTLRLRAEKGNVTKAYIEYSNDGKEWNTVQMQLEKVDKTGYFEFFVGTIPGQEQMFKYRFRVGNENPDNEVYYSRTNIGKRMPTFDEVSVKADNCWCMIPGYHSPDWAKGVLWYSVMPDAFYNGDITNDEPISGGNLSNSWGMLQHTLQYKYGGDLKGVEKKLKYIKDLGCEAVFLDPIFRATQNAGYGTEFYNQIENSFGNKQALIDLAKAIHDQGMHYMLDIVLQFVPEDHYWFDKSNLSPFSGAAKDWNSEYHDFFRFNGEEGDTNSYVSSWGGVQLNLANEKLKEKLYKDKDSYLQYYCKEPFCVDALRFDCGGTLSGVKEDGTEIGNVEIVGEMRPYLKEMNPEMLLLSEYSMYYAMDTGVWDSRWNLQFVGSALPYMRGEISESELRMRFDEEMHNIPRTIGHCQYNSMADHDRPRMMGVEAWAYRAYQLIHMTEIGSPCIYYGDEIGLLREFRHESSFYAMEWNESVWDYDRFYDTKALTELRRKFPVLKQGIIKYICVDDKNHILAFARMDEDDTVITVASRNAEELSFIIDVRDLGEVDGTVFTDWFTGKEYVAENGYIGVTLQTGGTIFVKGKASSSYKGGFAIDGCGDAATKVTMPKSRTFMILEQETFVNRDVFNTCEISARYVDKGGAGMLQIRGAGTEETSWIGAMMQAEQVTVYVKEQGELKKVASCDAKKDAYIKIIRKPDNRFDVCMTNLYGEQGIPCSVMGRRINDAWTVIAENIQVDIPNHAKAGMVATEGVALFENVVVNYEEQTILASDFTSGHSAMFDFKTDMDIQYGVDGLTVNPRQDCVKLLSHAYNDDWTFKAQFDFTGREDGDFAGVVSAQDDDIYVAAGRMYSDGKPVFVFGRSCAGKFVIYHTVSEEKPDQKAIIQLQRIGTTYTAIYSYDDMHWQMIGRDIIANMCVERAGLIVQGTSKATYTFACYGDAIHDGKSYNTPHTPIKIQTDFSDMVDTMIPPAYSIVSGEWSFANEGYLQTSKQLAQMGIHNKFYRDLKIDGTYVFESGEGFIGFEFGKKAYNSPLGDGVLFKVQSDGTISLVKAGKTIAKASLPEKYKKEVKLSVEYRHGVLIVFAGQEGEPILVLNNFEKIEGYIAYFMDGVVGHINNYLAASYDANCYYCAAYEPLDFSKEGVTKNWLNTNAFLNPFGVAVTDFVATARFNVIEWGANAMLGFCVSSPEAKFVKGRSLKIAFGQGPDILVLNGPDAISVGKMKPSTKPREVMVVRQRGEISVFVDFEKEPLIRCSDIRNNGGVVSLFANVARVRFENFKLVNLESDEQLDNVENYKEWINT